MPDSGADHVADMIVNGNRRDARLAIRLHSDPAWFVLEVLENLSNGQRDLMPVELANMRRLLNV